MATHAVHNPLLLPELFHYILDYIDVPNPVEIGTEHRIRVHKPTRTARKALFALAQTCRAISEPSLDRLWRALDSLVPLIRCFAPLTDVDWGKTTPSPAEWAINRRYAIRVRELQLRITGSPESVLSMYFVQCTSSQPLCLLPNLRTLVWDQSSLHPSLAALVEKLLVPELVSLKISLEGEVAHPLFERYVLLCPNLKVLQWDFGPVYHDGVISDDALSDSVLRLKKVENLKLFVPFDPITLKRVILSPDYKVLGIMLDPPLGVEHIDVTPADTPFPNVEAMELEIWDLDFLTNLLRPHQQMFRTLVFNLHLKRARPLVQSMLSCFTALTTPQRINIVRSIDIHLDCFSTVAAVEVLEDAPMSYCITYEALSPLASFRYLCKLTIILDNQISIDDDELASLACSWPSLEVLHLACRSGGWPWASAKYITLRGLLALIAGCPELNELCLPIDARIVPMDASPDIRNTAIKCVGLPDSLISEPRLVADFFRKHLPCVEEVMAGWHQLLGGDVLYMQECELMWQEVEELL